MGIQIFQTETSLGFSHADETATMLYFICFHATATFFGRRIEIMFASSVIIVRTSALFPLQTPWLRVYQQFRLAVLGLNRNSRAACLVHSNDTERLTHALFWVR